MKNQCRAFAVLLCLFTACADDHVDVDVAGDGDGDGKADGHDDEPQDADVGRLSEFIGTWDHTGTWGDLDCDNAAGAHDDFDRYTRPYGRLQLMAGSMSDLIAVPGVDVHCAILRYDVTGSTATLQPGQACSITLDNGYSSHYTFVSGSYTLSDDGQMITGAYAWEETHSWGYSGGDLHCTETGTIGATRFQAW
jgi:hypothetical protein